ncbi:M15 family metallopeptidase [Alkalibacterium olivapovliticus]|uniref:D-alanyl-D-alanine carboxypeptidase n=1 Tax=Alkalibacterium olivapovliticus TaxID=99907 RepID=A0A2T0W8G6_9LACT|nr:M15 family metallopeptidase [Alkalibacterium olivapovliticus]PRY82834.1 D-alanyl-D-alanine carboxypeptidase [Alkalibacterium olivapovliticus]
MIVKRMTQSISLFTSLIVLAGCASGNGEETGPSEVEETEIEGTTGTDESQGENPEESQDQEETDDEGETGSQSAQDSSADEEEDSPLNFEDDLMDPDSLKVLVNKQYALPEDYEPADLVTVEVPTVLDNPEIRQLRTEAAEALKDMFDAAEEEGIFLHARSGYRSYQTQVQLYNSYVSNHGEEAANRYSAQPGHSEHQTGLGMDVTSESVSYQLTEAFGDTPEGIWVEENSHEFGYIIRYPQGKEDITGYQYEPWHLRYLGQEVATDVFESGLTYEEYLIESGIDIEINE